MNKNEFYLSTEKNVNNVYIRFEHLRDLNKYINSTTKFYMSNISKKKTEILSFLKKYAELDKIKKREYSDKKNREGYIFEVMLPHDAKLNDHVKEIKQYVRELVKSVSEGNKLHYFVTITELGKARMLNIIILNRVMYLEGKEVEYIRYNQSFTKTIFISTKVRLNPFATKNSNSNRVFEEKMKHLKIMLLRKFNKDIKKVKYFFKKMTYKKIFFAEAINEYKYVDDTLDQRTTLAELKKRRITIINLLIETLNLYIHKKAEINDIERFKEKWTNILYQYKTRRISEINDIEEEILIQISSLKTFKI